MHLSRFTYAIALASTVALASLSWGVVGAADAAPGTHQDHGRHLGQGSDKAEHKGQHKGQHEGEHGAAGTHPGHGHGHGQPHGHGHGQPHGNGPAPGDGHAPGGPRQHDPAGNNGTIKIAELGSLDMVPNNTPHPGCNFQVEWYGFDGGPGVVSTVTFAMHAPTSDVGLTVDGPAQVPVGEDAASGAGTGTGLDAVQGYTLHFDGAPHPKQGYHVRLTVATPRSQGNDTKTKVFWVQPCATGTAASSSTSPGGGNDVSGGSSGGGREQDGRDEDASSITWGASDAETPAAATQVAPSSVGGDTLVPTAVDAGGDGSGLPAWAHSRLPLTLIAGGLVLVGVGIVVRNTRA